MNKQSLLEKRYIVRLLGIVLEGGKSNKEISERLKKGPSIIHPQLEYLENQGLIFKERDKEDKHNRKEYWINGDNLSEHFLTYIGEKKDLNNITKFKKNVWIILTLNWIISANLNRQDVVSTTLKNIFDKAYEYFLTISRDTKTDKEKLTKLMQRYKINEIDKQKTEEEFKLFLEALYKKVENI